MPDFTDNSIGFANNQPQWLRKCSLIVADANGNGLDLSELQVKFEVVSATVQTAKRLECTIFNLSDAVAQQIQNEFVQIQLSAGYQGGPFGIIFSGAIAYVRRGKQSNVDSFVTITATDGEAAYNWSTINATLAAGASQQDKLNAVLAVLGQPPFNIIAGYIPSFPPSTLPRGKAMFGMVRDILTDLALSVQCDYHIADGQLNFVPKQGFIPGDVITIGPTTGLISVPEQTVDGLNVRALLNPNLKTGHLIQVPASSVTTSRYNTTVQPDYQPNPLLPGLDVNGTYKIYSLHQSGDTRGNAWYSDMICVAMQSVNNIGPGTQTYLNAIVQGN